MESSKTFQIPEIPLHRRCSSCIRCSCCCFFIVVIVEWFIQSSFFFGRRASLHVHYCATIHLMHTFWGGGESVLNNSHQSCARERETKKDREREEEEEKEMEYNDDMQFRFSSFHVHLTMQLQLNYCHFLNTFRYFFSPYLDFNMHTKIELFSYGKITIVFCRLSWLSSVSSYI